MTSPADHAATLRGALWHGQGLGGHNNYRAAEEALASLVALADRATELKRERDEALKVAPNDMDVFIERAERAETALRRIATDSENPHTALGHIGYIARAALGETAPPEGSA